jgi:hypothetical protein
MTKHSACRGKKIHYHNCNGWCGGGVCGSWGKGNHLGSRGARPARRGKRQAVGLRQWRRADIAEWLQTQETGSPHHQETFMHRVSVIVHCVIVYTLITITGIAFFCIICFRNHLVANTICIYPLMYGKLCRAQQYHIGEKCHTGTNYKITQDNSPWMDKLSL